MKITNWSARKYSKLYNSGPFVVWISYSLETDILTGLERARTLHSELYTGRFFAYSTSSPCLQGDLLTTLSTRWLISSLPRQFYPRTLIIRLLVTRGCRRHQEAWTIKILSILTSGASRQSIRPGPHDDHTPSDTGHGAHYRVTRTRYRGIIVLFVFPVCYLLSV